MANAASMRVQKLMKKTTDVDSDERYMAVSDICTELQAMEEATVSRVASGASGVAAAGQVGLDAAVQQSLGRALLSLLEDSSSDVQTVSVKCLSLLSRRLGGDALLGVVDRLVALVCERTEAREASRDIYAIGLKTMIQAVAPDNGSNGGATAMAAPAAATLPPPGVMALSASATGAGTHATAVHMASRMLGSLLHAGLAAPSPSPPEAGVDGPAVEALVLEVMQEVLSRFGGQLDEGLHEPLLEQLVPRISAQQDTLRKRGVSTLGALVPHLSDALFQSFLSSLIAQMAAHEAAAHNAASSPAQRAAASALLYSSIQMIGLVSTTAGSRLAQWLPQIVPQLAKFLVLPTPQAASPTGSAASAATEQLVELSEHALTACESLISCCPAEFAPFLPAILRQAAQLLAYDPNYEYAADEGEEEQQQSNGANMEDDATKAPANGEGDDDEDWGAADDWGDDDDEGGAGGGGAGGASSMPDDEDAIDAEDDSSTWKVRRAACKLLDAFIRFHAHMPAPEAETGAGAAASSSAQLHAQYEELCGILLDRFKERDPHVRQHVLTAMADWVRESARQLLDDSGAPADVADGADQAMTDASSTSSSSQHLLSDKVVSSIVAACLKHLRRRASSSASTAVETRARLYIVLAELCSARKGCLDQAMGQLVPLLLGAIGQVHLAQGTKVDAVALLRACVERAASAAPFSGEGGAALVEQILAALEQAVAQTPYIKFKSEALLTVSALLVCLGSAEGTAAGGGSLLSDAALQRCYSLIHRTLSLNDVDTELKESALQAWGWLFFYFGRRVAKGSFETDMHIILSQRLANELTRLAALRTITRVAGAPVAQGLNVAALVLAPSSGQASSRTLEELVSFLKKDSQVLQLETVHALLAVLANAQAQAQGDQAALAAAARSWNREQVSSLLREAALHLSDADLNLSNALLQLLSSFFRLCPEALVLSSSAAAVSDADVLLARVLAFLRSPLLQTQNLLTLRGMLQTLMALQYPARSAPATQGFNSHLSFAFLFDTMAKSVAQGAPAATGAAGAAATVAAPVSQSYLAHAAQMVGSGLLLHIPSSEQTPVLQRLVDTIKGSGAGANASDSSKQFALLVLGELGRHVFLAPLHPALNEQLFFACFAPPHSEALRMAAALAFGQVALGQIDTYLPTLLQQMAAGLSTGAGAAAPAGEKEEEVRTRRLLLLHSLRELIDHIATGEHPSHHLLASGSQPSTASASPSPTECFRRFIPTLLPLLWRQASAPGAEEESVRSLVSEVLGGVLLLDAQATFPEMARLAGSDSAAVRATVITALRHALTQQQQHALASANVLPSQRHVHSHAPALQLDPTLLSEHMAAFLRLLSDADLSVRRQAILTVSALAHTAGGHRLLQGAAWKETILPTLYKHLKPDPSLVRTVNLGPFSHKIDDGLPLRLASFQTLTALLTAGFPLLEPREALLHLQAGLGDQEDIVALVYQCLAKLAATRPNDVAAVLDHFPQKMMDGIKDQLKKAKAAAAASAEAAAAAGAGASAAAPAGAGNGSEQSSGERAREVLRTAMRCMLALAALPVVKAQCPQFVELFQRVLKTAMLARIIEDIKQEGQ